MAVAQGASGLNPTSRKNARWRKEDDQVSIDTLKMQQSKGNQTDSGWKHTVWTACEVALQGSEKDSGGGPKTERRCKEHWHSLRKSYLMVKNLTNQPGWGWDDELRLVIAPPNAWDAHLTAHPEAKRWQHTPFPYYSDLQVLVGEGNHATRERAYRPSRGNDNENGDMSSIQGVGDTDDVGVSQSTDTTSQAADSWVTSSNALNAKRTLERHKVSPRMLAAIQSVADAIYGLSTSMSAADPFSTPKRREAAFKAIEQDDTFSTPEQMKIWNLFYKDMAAADSYMSIVDVRKRHLFIRGLLDMTSGELDENPFLV